MPLSNEPTMPHSRLQIFPSKPIKKYQRNGIALLITLVILALLSIFMTEFAFETTLETRGIRNFQASFKARNAVKSMFKAVLVGLEEQDEVTFFRKYLKNLLELGNLGGEISYLNPPAPIRLPAGLMSDFPDVAFFTPYIRPIDHLYNLNRISEIVPNSDLDMENRNKFFNIMKSIVFSIDSGNSPTYSLDENQILGIYGNIYDWTDSDQDPYPEYGQEYYQDSGIGIEIKNKKLDRLNEIQLMESVKTMGASFENMQWSRYFTVHKVGMVKDDDTSENRYLNVNLATGTEIKNYLTQFEDNTNLNDSTQEFIARASDIAFVLETSEKKVGNNRFKNDAEIQTALNNSAETSALQPIAKKYFIPYSFWYEIHLKTEIDNVQAELKAVVSLKRETNGNVKPNSIVIHDFLLR